MYALQDLGLRNHISRDAEHFITRVKEGKTDPAVDTSHHLTRLALQIFGPEFVTRKRCPVCAFHAVVERVTERVAVNYQGKEP